MPKRRFKKKQYRKGLASRVRALEKKQNNVEVKVADTDLSASISTTWASLTCNQLTQGTGEGNVLGGQATMDGLMIRGALTLGDSTNVVRLVVFLIDANVAASGFGDIFEYNNDLYSPYKSNSDTKFKILWDKNYSMVTGAPSQVIQIHENINLKHAKAHYDAGSSTPVKNKLGFAYLSDSAAVAHPDFEGYSRLYYTDQ